MDKTYPYRGRFAPTPSGPLHLGSLMTALAGWLQARRHGGKWLLRMDDLDTPRCLPGASEQILRQLEAHGLVWDETPRYQSRHVSDYLLALQQLQARDIVYPCSCTRAELQKTSLPGPDGPVYAGTCRDGAKPALQHSLRLRLPSQRWCLADEWQGQQCRTLPTEVGDFVLQRADGQIGYQLACVVDEAAQGITEVVRGADLIGSSLRQNVLQSLLGLPTPAYVHLPLLVNRAGLKLSKQNHAPPIAGDQAGANLWLALHYLRQSPPAAIKNAAPPEVLAWAQQNWRPAAFAGQLQHSEQ